MKEVLARASAYTVPVQLSTAAACSLLPYYPLSHRLLFISPSAAPWDE